MTYLNYMKFDSLLVSINKVLSIHGQAHLLTYCLWLLLHDGRVKQSQWKVYDPQSLKYWLSGHLQKTLPTHFRQFLIRYGEQTSCDQPCGKAYFQCSKLAPLSPPCLNTSPFNDVLAQLSTELTDSFTKLEPRTSNAFSRRTTIPKSASVFV